MNADEKFEELKKEMFHKFFEKNPHFASYLGLHDPYDYLLPKGATAEVRRYTQTPSYALSYLLGKHLILQLREEVKQKMGTKYNEKFFHDTITANGFLPISLLRKVFNQK